MRWVVEYCLKFRVLVMVLVVALVVFGGARVRDVPLSIMPEYGPPLVRVQTEALGLSPAEVEQFITAPLEQDLLNGVAFLKKITSSSVPGLSVVDMEFEPGTDIFVARQVVQERLTQAHALPNVSTPPQMIQPVSSTGRVMMIGLTSDDVSLIDMSLLARWTIKPRLVGVPGVANVAIWGMRDRQLQIRVDPADLNANDVSLRELVATSANALWTSPLGFVEASTPGTGGWIETPNQRLAIQHELPINTAADLSRVVIAKPGLAGDGGAWLTIGDLADVVEDHQPLIGDASFSGQPGLMIVVEKFPWANTRDVTLALDEALAELRPGFQGINVNANVYRPNEYLESATGNLSSSAVIGALLGLIALIVLVWDWRAIAVSVVAIPLSLLGAFVVLVVVAEAVNLVLLVGLAAGLALVIDAAVASTHSIFSGASAGNGEASPERRSSAAIATGGTLAYVFVVLVLALLPVIYFDGAAGALFSSIVWAYLCAVAAAIVIALTVTPVLSWYLFKTSSVPLRVSPVIGVLRRIYEGIVASVLKMRMPVLLIALGMSVAAVALIPLTKQTSLVPQIRESAVMIDFRTAPGTSVPETLRLTSELTTGIRELPGVADVGSHIGRSLVGDEVVDVSSGQIWAVIASSADYEATLAKISAAIENSSGITADTSAYANAQVDHAMQMPKADLIVRVYGARQEVLATEAARLSGLVAAIDGVGAPEVEQTLFAPAIDIRVDLQAAAKAGISPGDVRRTASIMLSGLIVGQFFEAQKVFDVVVWGKPETRQDVSSIEALLIDTPSGEQVRLGDVADVSIVERAEEIRREASSRYVDILASVEGRDIATVEADVLALLSKTPMPYEYHATVLKQGEEIRQQRNRTLSIVIASIAGVFLVLQAAVSGWLRAVLISVGLLASMSGAMLAAVLIGNLSLGVYAALIAVFGLALAQSLLSYRAVLAVEHEPGYEFGEDLVRQVALARFAPTVTSAAALLLFFVVFVFANGSAGYVLLAPFAVVLLAGAITTLFTNLVLLPTLCLMAGPGEKVAELVTGPLSARAEGAVQ